MKAFSSAIVASLERIVQALDAHPGRIIFCAFVAIYGLALGALTVIRAEFPKKTFVAKPHYSSPLIIGAPEDRQAEYHSSEFREFRTIAWGAVIEGLDQYSDISHVRAYPPFFAIAFFPFAMFWRWWGVGSALFFLVNYACGLVAALCLTRWHPQEEKAHKFGWFALIWIILAPFVGAVTARCESDMLVVAPIAVALMLLARGRKTFAAGALLGFAASFKVLPGLFGVFLLCRRRWKPFWGMAVGGLACTIVLPAIVWGPKDVVKRHISWYNTVVAPYHKEGPEAFIGRPYRSTNQSLTAAVHRFLTPIQAGKRDDMRRVNLLSLSPRSAARIAFVLRAVIGLGFVALWALPKRREEKPAFLATLFATVPLATLLLSEVSLTTHHVTLIVPCAVILSRALEPGEEAAREWVWSVCAALAICVIGASKTVRMLSPFLAATLILLTGTVAIALRDMKGNPPTKG